MKKYSMKYLRQFFFNFVKNIYKDIDKFMKNLGVANENF